MEISLSLKAFEFLYDPGKSSPLTSFVEEHVFLSYQERAISTLANTHSNYLIGMLYPMAVVIYLR